MTGTDRGASDVEARSEWGLFGCSVTPWREVVLLFDRCYYTIDTMEEQQLTILQLSVVYWVSAHGNEV